MRDRYLLGSARLTATVGTAVFGGLLAGAGGAGFLAAFDTADLVPALVVATAAGILAAWCGLLVASGRAAAGPPSGSGAGSGSGPMDGGAEVVPPPVPSVGPVGTATVVGVRLVAVVGALVTAVAAVPGVAPAALIHLGEGWAGLQDGHTPVSPGSAPAGAVVAVPVVLTVVAAAGGAWLAQPAGWRLRAWCPGLAVMVVGFLVGDERTGAPVWVPVAWGLLALGTVAVTTRRPAPLDAGASGAPEPARLRSVAVGTVVLVMLVLTGAAAVPAGEWVPLDDERERLPRSPGIVPREEEQPLGQVVRLRGGEDQVLFTVDSPEPVGRWYLTVLDRYDGSTWTSSQEFRRAAERLPSATGCPRPAGDSVTHRVELAGPDGSEPVWGRWLPAPAGATAVSEDGLLYDRASGALRVPVGEPVPPSYEVTADLPAGGAAPPRAEARVPRASTHWPASDLPDVDGHGAPGGMVDDLEQLARELTAGATSDYGKAAALSQFLLAGELVEDNERGGTPSGASLAAVHDFIAGGQGTPEGRESPQGTVAQYVTAFALLARTVDLPTRVVVGFDGSAAAGPREVRAHDATAWAEVCFEELGWVPFDVIPDDTGEVLAPELEPAPAAAPDPASSARDTGSSPDTENSGSDTDEGDGSDRGRVAWGLPRWLLGVVLGVLMVATVAVAAAPVVWRWMTRQRRRRVAAPARRVAGAWATVVDDLRAAGHTFSDAAAVSAVAEAGGLHLPDAAEPLAELAGLVNRAAFARGDTSENDAARAWHLADAVLAGRRRHASVGTRLRSLFRW